MTAVGPKADIDLGNYNVRFTSNSGPDQAAVALT